MEYECVRRAPRYFLTIDVEITELDSGRQIVGQTKILSLSGCCVGSAKQVPQGTSVGIKLSHCGKEVRALARVVYSSSDFGMGLAFTSIEPEDEWILHLWIEDYVRIPIWER